MLIDVYEYFDNIKRKYIKKKILKYVDYIIVNLNHKHATSIIIQYNYVFKNKLKKFDIYDNFVYIEDEEKPILCDPKIKDTTDDRIMLYYDVHTQKIDIKSLT